MSQWKVKNVVLAGAGFFADAYDLFAMNIVLKLLDREFGGTPHDKGLVASTALWGAVLGQIFFGTMADKFGRKIIFVTTIVLITIGCIGSSLSTNSSYFSIYKQIALFQFILGVGVGGEYPLSATVTSESTPPSHRGKLMASVFAMQGIGALMSSLVVYTCLDQGATIDFTWRFTLAVGAAPGVIAFYWRWKMHETTSFQKLQDKAASLIQRRSLWQTLSLYRWHMMGTAMTWFLFDIVFYANGLFSSTVMEFLHGKGNLKGTASSAAMITGMGIPGYWLAVASMDCIGRRNIQMMGLTMLAILYWVLGYFFDSLKEKHVLFIVLYGFTFLFSNFGPNVSTYVIPGEIYPTEVRATCHGLSAASGKVGAAVGAYLFPVISEARTLGFVVQICGGVAVVALIVTFFFTPGYGIEELTQQAVQNDEQGFATPVKMPFTCFDPSPEIIDETQSLQPYKHDSDA